MTSRIYDVAVGEDQTQLVTFTAVAFYNEREIGRKEFTVNVLKFGG